jgi:hypothetical protein
VRDMLLDKEPDDLDISINLSQCPRDATLAAVMQGLPAFASARPELAVSQVRAARGRDGRIEWWSGRSPTSCWRCRRWA